MARPMLLLPVALLAALAWLTELSSAEPIHGVIPYYKELKKEREREEHLELIRDCRNPASTNPRCAELSESGELYLEGSAHSTTGSFATALASGVMVVVAPRFWR